MGGGALGRAYADGEVIVREGEAGDCMYVVQEGNAEVVESAAPGVRQLAVLGPGDVFGEMSLFERERRSATVRALGEARVLAVDRKTLLRRLTEDPLLAVNIIKTLSGRLREADAVLARSRCGSP